MIRASVRNSAFGDMIALLLPPARSRTYRMLRQFSLRPAWILTGGRALAASGQVI